MIRGDVKRIWVLHALRNPYIVDEIRSSKISWSEIALFTEATSQLDLNQVISEDLIFQLLTLTGSKKFLVGVDSILQPFFSAWISENSLYKRDDCSKQKERTHLHVPENSTAMYVVTLEPMSAKTQLILGLGILRKKKRYENRKTVPSFIGKKSVGSWVFLSINTNYN